MATTEQVIVLVEGTLDLVALGIDTLTCWGTGPGGLATGRSMAPGALQTGRQQRRCANGLFGSMGVNGMALLLAVRGKRPEVFVAETHPKVLLWHIAETKYDYTGRKELMDTILARALGTRVAPSNGHEWDAALSAFAALEGVTRR